MLPKTLQADPVYSNDIRDQNESLVISVYSPSGSDGWTAEELRGEIIHRWNAYEVLMIAFRTMQQSTLGEEPKIEGIEMLGPHLQDIARKWGAEWIEYCGDHHYVAHRTDGMLRMLTDEGIGSVEGEDGFEEAWNE